MIRNKRSQVVFVLMVTVMLLLAAMPVMPAYAAGPVSVLQAWPSTPTGTGTTSPVNTTFTVSAGSNRLMVVAVDFGTNSNVGGSGISVAAVYGQGSPSQKTLTPITMSSNTQRRSAWLGYLKEADIATAGNNSLRVTVTGMPGGNNGINVYVSTYTGVDQTTPIGASYNNYNSQSSAVLNFGTGLAVQAGGLGIFTTAEDVTGVPTVTVDTPYTLPSSATQMGSSGNYSVWGYKTYASAATANPTITYSGTIRGGIAAATINPVALTATTTSVASSLNPSTYGASVTFTATVTTGATGTVEFYDGLALLDTGTLGGTPNTATYATSALTAAASHSITAKYLGDGTYAGSTSSALSQVVNKANQAITVGTPAPTSAAYGDSFTVAATGGASGNPIVYTASGSCTVAGATYTMTSGSGTCSVLYDQAGNGNYNAAPQVANTVNAQTRAIAVTADAKSKTYGDGDPALTYTHDPLAFSDTFSGALTRDAGEDVGPYAITQGDLALSSNYTLAFTGANLTIGKKTLNVSADAKSKTYGDGDPALTYTHDPLAFSDTFSGALTRDAGEDVGPYAITQGDLALSSNYTLVFTGANLTIGKKTLNVGADAKSKTYGDGDPALTYTHDPLAFSDTFSGALTRDAGEDVGPYAITQGTLALSSNYTITFVPANFTITAKPITVTADADQGKVIGAIDPVLTYTSSDPAVIFIGALGRAAGEDIGTYAINQGDLSAGSNYTITFVPANFTITAKSVTVTADAKTKVYGEGDPALTYTSSDPAVIFTGALSRATGETVGTYAISRGDLSAGSDYTINFIPANFTITAKPITVTADARSKTYGDIDPALTYTHDPLAFSDTFSGALTRDAGENVGMYAITQGDLALSSNYTLSFTGANLTIGKKTINVSAEAKSKTYGDGDPALTYTHDPLVGSDAITGALSRDAGENVGMYAITQGTLSAGSNYTLNYTSANLTIVKKTINVGAEAKSKTYGDGDPALTYTHDPLVGSDAFTGALSRVAGETVGTYAITQGNLSAGSNYTIVFVSADFTITPASTTTALTSSANPSVFGASVAFTATVAPSAVTGTVQFYADGATLGSPVALSGGTASVSSTALSVGTHVITATYSGDANYSASTSAPLTQTVEATQILNPVPTITSLSPTTATVRGPDFTLLVTGTNFVNGSTVHWNGAERTTTLLSSTLLSATITTGDLAASGQISVTVVNPPPGGGPSNALPFMVVIRPATVGDYKLYLPLVVRN